MYYINKYEQAATYYLLKLGFTRAICKQNNWGIAVLEQNIQYFAETLEDDVLRIETFISDKTRKVITLTHEMKNEETGELVSRAIMKYVLLDREKRKALLLSETIFNNGEKTEE
jgi:YbgC/YbaW family acyl-CoA thioester hydrolase